MKQKGNKMHINGESIVIKENQSPRNPIIINKFNLLRKSTLDCTEKTFINNKSGNEESLSYKSSLRKTPELNIDKNSFNDDDFIVLNNKS